MRAGAGIARAGMLAAGFTFLYGPILLLVVYSFNASRLVTVWGGASMRWYAALLQDPQLIASVRTSLLVALVSAVIAFDRSTRANPRADTRWKSSRSEMHPRRVCC